MGFRRSLCIYCKFTLSGSTKCKLIHASYNSAVFSSIAVNDYYALSVSESFIRDDECYNCGNLSRTSFADNIPALWQKAHNNELERLSNIDCIQAYAEMFQTKRRNLLLVASDDKMPSTNESEYGLTRVYSSSFVSSSQASSSATAQDIYGRSEPT